MKTGAEYFDRLSWNKIDALRELVGGELGWKQKHSSWSKSTRIKIGKIVFGDVLIKDVTFEFEEGFNGWDIPVIIGHFE